MSNIIEFNNVNFKYDKDIIIDSAHFAISENEFTGIIGPNGGGKTTLLKLLLGILQPSSGTISILGKSAKYARKDIGYMPQYLQYDKQFPATVLDIVLMGRLTNKLFTFYSNKDKEIAMNSLEQMEVAHLANTMFSELSGGQRQRILIARALASEPKILLLDEPTANIDPALEDKFYNLLKKLAGSMTIVSVSHDLRFVMNIVEKVICINRNVHIHSTEHFKNDFIDSVYNTQNYNIVQHGSCKAHDHCSHI